MCTPIDYSKWDSMNFEDSETEEEPRSRPNCISLDQPSSVSIGPDGVHLGTSAPPPPVKEGATKSLPESPTGAEAKALEELVRNGGREGDSHCWSQTIDAATVSFIMPPAVKSKDISGFRIYEVEPNKPQIEFRYTADGATTCVAKLFKYPLKVEEGVLEGCWELRTIGVSRFLVVQVVKKEMMQRVALWWDQCFADDVLVVDTRSITDRKGTSGEKFSQVWAEAHELFRKRMKERKSREV